MIPETLAHLAIPIDSIQPHPRNVRQGDVGAISESLKLHGQYRPIVVQKSTGHILAGNHTYKAAKALKWKQIAATYVDVTDDQAVRILLMDNRANDLASYDDPALAEILKQLMETEQRLEGTGFDPDDLEQLLRDIDAEQLPTVMGDPDDVPEDVPAKTVPGDVWLLGRHRLRCGDSTSPSDMDALMNGQQADLIFTDPPYGMSYGGGRAKTKDGQKVHQMIKNDDLQANDLIQLVQDALVLAKTKTKQNAAVYACFTWRTYTEFEKAVTNAGLAIKSCIVWDKQSVGLGNAHYRPQHEFIFYCEGDWHGDKSQSDVWQLSRGNTSAYVHPTQKPVELISIAINNSSSYGDVVLDPFGGSGSTLIAAEQTNRTAYLMELDPHYCDVICARFQKATGIKPIAEATGNEHNFL
jgi:site-specific DNA-methyltransferase (adenine-specific)